MKINKVYPNKWQTVPFTFDLFAGWKAQGRAAKELILKNEVIKDGNIAEMTFNIYRFSAVDSEGREYLIQEFSENNAVTFKGMQSGHFVRLGSLVNLPARDYTALRFHVRNQGNVLRYADGNEENANQLDHLDFTIENGFTIKDEGVLDLKLWFDLVPFHWNRHWKAFIEPFSNKNPRPRWANSF
ncbi:hypothetical protein GTQ34_12665 [Muricauda sp. JGD-17]|uniref:Uncharacterized protein n=1 Tax=Flagellimonas ochracea TaxID=2696472 RepID=A0A964WY47_9FLAO|nr:hypothetical protein [Allomuricauda ochracea]NAY92770.1 hypothetical protein [Allomuricauda ochracea]